MSGTTSPTLTILTSSSAGWDDVRRAWNLAVDQQPAAIALPESPEDIVAAVKYAQDHGLRVAAQGTGHNAAPLGPLFDTMLIKTNAMRDVTIDADRMTAWVGAGAVWRDVADAAAEYGLAGLAGSSPDVGVVGYTLGGGMSWLGRTYGLSANNVHAFDVVTADGQLRRADATHEPDLFWALRGGGGSFGVVTAVELQLFPVTNVSAGLLWWPIAAAPQVLPAWRELTHGELPDEFTTTARLMRLPDIEEMPESVRGGAFVVIDVIHLGSLEEADRILMPLRALRPAMDTVQAMPARELGRLHMDPEQPTPAAADGMLLDDLPEAAVDELIRCAGPAADSPLLAVELRHLGGQLRRARPESGALAAVDAQYLLFAGGVVTGPESAATVMRSVRALQAAVAPWRADQMYLNLAETSRDPASFWTPDAYARLRHIKAEVDPDDRIQANHPVPPAMEH